MTSRRERRKRDTRSALLEAARALFAQRGIAATRVEDLTDEADLGKGAFYNYFASKLDLVAALVEEGVGVLQRDYLGRVAATTSPDERLLPVARALLAFFADYADYALLFHQARGLIEPRPARTSRLEAAFGRYLTALADGVLPPTRREQLEHRDAEDLAAVLAGTISGYRSFRTVVSAPADETTLLTLLASGFTAAVEERRGRAPR